MNAVIRRLRAICQSWGGDLRIVTMAEFCARAGLANPDRDDATAAVERPDGLRGFWEAPFTSWHGFDYEPGVIYVVDQQFDPGAAIHEMGHLFVDRFIDHSDEWDWFGWEVAVARIARCYRTWDKQNYGYTIRAADGLPSVEWGSLRGASKARVIAERIDQAMSRGYLDHDGRPIAKFTRPLTKLTRDRVRRRVAKADADWKDALQWRGQLRSSFVFAEIRPR